MQLLRTFIGAPGNWANTVPGDVREETSGSEGQQVAAISAIRSAHSGRAGGGSEQHGRR